ncbi:MAG: hypothetical protein HYY37_04610 [Candidatus Aenigmarchaeota archaeon]|nr:hypothetical protein [Candidatus Aenigmarchaeota archaeon]
MKAGKQNLTALFNATVAELEAGMPKAYRSHLLDYRKRLVWVRAALETRPEDARKPAYGNALAYAILHHWQRVPLERAATLFYPHNTYDRAGGEEDPYASGFSNAATLVFNPSRSGGRYNNNPEELFLSGYNETFVISPEPLRATRKVLTPTRMFGLLQRGKQLEHDGASALEAYLDALERRIEEEVVACEGTTVAPRQSFYLAPDIGLGLVGFGDAVLRAGREGKRVERYAEIAERSYADSGLGNTLHVGKQLMQLGALPQRTHVAE